MLKFLTISMVSALGLANIASAAENPRILRCEVMRLTNKGVEGLGLKEIKLGFLPEVHDLNMEIDGYRYLARVWPFTSFQASVDKAQLHITRISDGDSVSTEALAKFRMSDDSSSIFSIKRTIEGEALHDTGERPFVEMACFIRTGDHN